VLNAVIIKYMYNILNTLWEWTEGSSKSWLYTHCGFRFTKSYVRD